MLGTVFGLVCALAFLVSFTAGLWMLAGAWGLLVSSVAWFLAAVATVKPEVLYAGTD